MKYLIFACLFLVQIVLGACSKSGPSAATAVIRVSVGSHPPSDAADVVTTAFTSFSLAQHAEEVLGLAKQWGVSAKEADEKIRAALSVRPGNKPDLFVVEASGLDHEAGVRIVNELCTYYGTLHPSVALNGGPAEAIHVTVVQPAK